MSCSCTPPSAASGASGAGKFFSKNSRRYLKRFRRKGLAKEQKYLVEGIAAGQLGGKTILEIGCGVGGVHLSLLIRGAASAVGIDAADRMIENASILANELFLDQQVGYLVGDFVTRAPEIASADITILDKVVCCYENMDDLVSRSLEKTRCVYALSFPKPNFFVRMSFVVPITLGTILRWSFRPYWHDWQKLIDTIENNGFRERYANSTMFWSVRVFERTSAAA